MPIETEALFRLLAKQPEDFDVAQALQDCTPLSKNNEKSLSSYDEKSSPKNNSK